MKSLFKSFRWIYSRATLLGVIKTGLSKHYRHFSLTFIVLIILSSTPIASAELYRISGSAIFSNTPPVAMEEVRIECSEFEYDCHTFEGIFSETNRNGIYEIEIELDCASIVFILAFFAALFRPNYADNGKGFRQSLSSEIVTCPVCEGKLEKHLLIRHLIVEHEVFPDEAAKIGSLAKTEEE